MFDYIQRKIASTTDQIFAHDVLVFPILPHLAQYRDKLTVNDHKRIIILNLQIWFRYTPTAITTGNFEINIQRSVFGEDKNLVE